MNQKIYDKSNLIFVLDKAEIYSACFRPKGVKTYERFSCLQQNVLTRNLFRILFRFQWLRPRLFNPELVNCGNSTVLTFDTAGREFVQWLRRNNPDNRIIVFFINTVRDEELVMLYKSLNCELWSFDPADCKKYEMKYNSWYCTFESAESVKKRYDVVFIGREKTRRPILEKFEEYFRDKGLSYYYHVTHERNYPIINPFKYKHHISYANMISIERQSRAMIEIVEPGQNGSTLRIMDSVFNEVKLITNFNQILCSPFYKMENIYVFDGKMELDGLDSFLKTPFKKYEKRLLEEYGFEKWISRFQIK